MVQHGAAKVKNTVPGSGLLFAVCRQRLGCCAALHGSAGPWLLGCPRRLLQPRRMLLPRRLLLLRGLGGGGCGSDGQGHPSLAVHPLQRTLQRTKVVRDDVV